MPRRPAKRSCSFNGDGNVWRRARSSASSARARCAEGRQRGTFANGLRAGIAVAGSGRLGGVSRSRDSYGRHANDTRRTFGQECCRITLALACPRVRWTHFHGDCPHSCCGCAGSAVLATLMLASPRDRAMAANRGDLQRRSATEEPAGRSAEDAQRDMDAMAVKLGELQAQSTRLECAGRTLGRGRQARSMANSISTSAPAWAVLEQNVAAGLRLPPTSRHQHGRSWPISFDHQQAQLVGAAESAAGRQDRIAASKPTGMPVPTATSLPISACAPDPFNGRSAMPHRASTSPLPLGTPGACGGRGHGDLRRRAHAATAT